VAGPVYFISDAHLGSSGNPDDDAPRLARLIPFLRSLAERRAERLYILGDLFDFWFEYAHVMPWRHARILAEIRRLVDSGVPVTFLGGNHDWWAGRSFERFAGMSVHRGPISVEHQGRRLHLCHGDGLSSRGDTGYTILKAILRNGAVIRILRLVHPDLAYAFGHRLSKFSREHLTARRFRVDPALAEHVDATLARGHDAFLMGHLHARHEERRPGGGSLFVLGDWMTLFSALRLEDGALRWEDWSSGAGMDAADPGATLAGGHGDEPIRGRGPTAPVAR
jgi:UDP-2,3-diacylglucosamine hydrolase